MIECQFCESVFDADTVQAHCFECGHLCCLECIKQLRKVGCPLNCPLPSHIAAPSSTSEVRRLNVSLATRVYVDFTDIAAVRDRLAEKEEELKSKDRIIRELTEKLREVNEDRAYYKRILEDERAMTVRVTEAALISAVSAQLDLLVKLRAAIQAQTGSVASRNWKSRGVQASPPPPPLEPVVLAQTASRVQRGVNEGPCPNLERAKSGNGSLKVPRAVEGAARSFNRQLDEPPSPTQNNSTLWLSPRSSTPDVNNRTPGEAKASQPAGASPAVISGNGSAAKSPTTEVTGAIFGSKPPPATFGPFSFSVSRTPFRGFPNSQFTFQVPRGLDSDDSRSPSLAGFSVRPPPSTEVRTKASSS
ncbi:hypothetical protein M407DRAFT_221630 [Tulasnella calospora MUT 4182]|uniref:RING-type domain-containing protein n=1 Tax=Tulasnella calospora MUT 4182 TaxID=1051891 RepID=A0A0C3LB45_9AGAM|nr:hypothetical protein M407DRAFT_221630 [Tulasnella calospora MUT 4182]